MSLSQPPPNPIDQTSFLEAAPNRGSQHSAIDSLRPSVITIILILSITVLISVSLCLLLRHLGRCNHFTNLSLPSSSPSVSRRVSPEVTAKSFVDSLPLFTFSSVRRHSAPAYSAVSGDCAVCLSSFELHDQLRLLPLCCHAFHAECIDTWLLSNQTCPLCRSSLYTSDPDLVKVLGSSSSLSAGSSSDSFRLEIGSFSRRQSVPDETEHARSYSIGSFRYFVEDDAEITTSDLSGWIKEEESLGDASGGSRNWLKDERHNDVGEEIGEMFRWLSGV